ncbi:hypothetical protein L218DRAFT_594833 [Marasmius fiardii PR-910]|nr:hypothetical protein L218DRAFT_594833 [Marasmius fiardii PR-910]
MIKHLKEIAPRPTFHACYSIVADPSVGHRTQAGVVARNIKKSANLPFSYKDALPPITPSTSSSCTLHFHCECVSRSHPVNQRPLASWLAADQKNRKDLMNTVPLKMPGSLADIRAKLAKSGTNPNAAIEETSVVSCNGTIEVTVEDDSSHPLGIPGQRIEVKIHHP